MVVTNLEPSVKVVYCFFFILAEWLIPSKYKLYKNTGHAYFYMFVQRCFLVSATVYHIIVSVYLNQRTQESLVRTLPLPTTTKKPPRVRQLTSKIIMSKSSIIMWLSRHLTVVFRQSYTTQLYPHKRICYSY